MYVNAKFQPKSWKGHTHTESEVPSFFFFSEERSWTFSRIKSATNVFTHKKVHFIYL